MANTKSKEQTGGASEGIVQTQLFVDKQGKQKERVVKSVNFYPDEESLLLWCLNRPSDFSSFVKQVLQQAKDGEKATNTPLTCADIREVVTDVFRTEIAGRLIAEAETTTPKAEETATDIRPGFYNTIDNLFVS